MEPVCPSETLVDANSTAVALFQFRVTSWGDKKWQQERIFSDFYHFS
jgi:hypothetical protein